MQITATNARYTPKLFVRDVLTWNSLSADFFVITIELLYFAVCKAKVDLSVLIDGSQSIDYFAVGNFRRCLQFVKNFVSGFNIAKEGTHVGIVVFSKNAEIIFGFEKYFSVQTVLTAIDSIKYPRSGTHTGKALDVVRTKLLDASARQGVPNILLVMTDGASQVSLRPPPKG